MRVCRSSLVLGVLCAASLAGCELIADFDAEGLDEGRTVPPIELPRLDGSTPIVVDGSVRDGAIVGDDPSDAAVPAGDAGTRADAAVPDLQLDLGMDGGNTDVVVSDVLP